jgi:hypothetical protein
VLSLTVAFQFLQPVSWKLERLDQLQNSSGDEIWSSGINDEPKKS